MERIVVDAAKGGFRLVDEFKEFAIKGNAIDLAVGVVIREEGRLRA